MIIDVISDAIKSNIGPLSPAPGKWLKRNCPLCHTQGHSKDTRHRFGIQYSPTNVIMNCFNCQFKAGFSEGKNITKNFELFLQQINIDQKFIDEIKFEIYKQKNQLSSTRDGDNLTTEDKELKFKSLTEKWKPIKFPKDTLSITEWLEHDLKDEEFLKVVTYAKQRGIIEFDNFYWNCNTDMNLNQRIIIPYYYNRKLVGYTARLYFDPSKKSIPKYMQECQNDFVYNLDNQIDWARKYVIVTEGVLDAWTVDGVATLGTINQSKIDIINRLQKEVIVNFDRDKAGEHLIDTAIEQNWAVSFPKWDDNIKDASQAAEKYGRLLTTHSIISSAITGKDKILVKWNIESNERNKKIGK